MSNLAELFILFIDNTREQKLKDGYSISCKKGLFTVYAPTRLKAYTEALHYFVPYAEDGEYDE